MSTLHAPLIPPGNSPASSPASNDGSLVGAIRRAISQPQFLAAFTVLFIAGLSLSAATQYMRLYFKKEPVPLAKPLAQIPPSLGAWTQVSADRELDPEMLDVLGTKQYIFRDYIDSRKVPPPAMARFKDQTDHEREQSLSILQQEHPEAVVRVSVTYYTGMVDTVAHIPDRCYVADGNNPESKETPTWNLALPDEPAKPLTVSLIHFEDGTPERHLPLKNVAYFFHCNGAYEYDAPTGVRRRLQNLSVRHSYYAKIEVMTQMDDREKSEVVMRDFLSSALPEIEHCMPDWQKVQAAENSGRENSSRETSGAENGGTKAK